VYRLKREFEKVLRRFKRPILAAMCFMRFSPGQALRVLRAIQWGRSAPLGETFAIALGAGAQIYLRARTTDIDIFQQIFIMGDCAVPLTIAPGLIIDGGAHIGCSVVYFARRYPCATIIAIEAHRDNFEILKTNAAPYANVTCIHGAVWGSDRSLRVRDSTADPWAFSVEPVEANHRTADANVRAFTIGTVLAMSGHDRVGLLKLDIEGAEHDVFSTGYESWLSKTDAINIELHDRLQPGCTEVFNAAVARYPFRRRRRTRHNVVLVRD
jgi:FkbM family methyltransferase